MKSGRMCLNCLIRSERLQICLRNSSNIANHTLITQKLEAVGLDFASATLKAIFDLEITSVPVLQEVIRSDSASQEVKTPIEVHTFSPVHLQIIGLHRPKERNRTVWYLRRRIRLYYCLTKPHYQALQLEVHFQSPNLERLTSNTGPLAPVGVTYLLTVVNLAWQAIAVTVIGGNLAHFYRPEPSTLIQSYLCPFFSQCRPLVD